MRDVSILSIGQIKVDEHWDKSIRHLAADAILAALAETNPGRIDTLFVGNMIGGEAAGQEHLGALIADFVGLRGVEAIRAHGPAVLLKGGHGEGRWIVDTLIAADGARRIWESERIETPHTHGTGCTLASAIAAGLARGLPLAEAIDRARLFVRIALREAPGLGAGHGPMGHHRVRQCH